MQPPGASDGHLNALAGLQAQLRGTQRRWEELHLLLGRRLAGPPVKLAVPVQAQPAQRRVMRSVPDYMTKVMRPGY